MTADIWTYLNLPIEVSSSCIADGICRTHLSNERQEACQAHHFSETALVSTHVNKKTPGIDHEFVAAIFTYALNSERNLVETWKFKGPKGEEMGVQTRLWPRIQ